MKKKTITSMGATAAVLSVGAIAISCGSGVAGNNGMGESIKWTKDDKTIGEITLEKLYELGKKKRSNIAQQVQDIINKSAQWLYEREVEGSVNMKKIREAHMSDTEKKNAGIKTLDSIDKIKERVKAEFEDEKTAFKELHGHAWEKPWSTELAKKAKYGKASSDEEAIDNMVTKQITSQAYTRYSIQKDSTTWKKRDVERGVKGDKDWKWLSDLKKDGFVFSADKNISYDQLKDGDSVIVVSTRTFDVSAKNPTNILGGVGKSGYINKYDPMVINHFLIPAVADPKNSIKPWKIKMEDAKKWLMSTEKKGANPKAAIDKISDFKGLTYNGTGKNQKFEVSDDDEILLKAISGNSSGVQKTGGSLGLKDELDYVKTMDPAFTFPFLNEDLKTSGKYFEVKKTNPFLGLSKRILDELQASINNSSSKTWVAPTNSKDWAKQLSSLLESVGDKKSAEIIGIAFRDAFGTQDLNKKRYVAYELSKDKYAVVSSFGVHIISKHFVKDSDELIRMLKSDIERENKKDSAFFNVVNELNKYSSDKMLIVESLLKNKDFATWIKTQPNYSNPDGNSYKKHTDADITKLTKNIIGSYNNILKKTRAREAVNGIKKWIDNSHMNETLEIGSNIKWDQTPDAIYNTALKIAEEGAVK